MIVISSGLQGLSEKNLAAAMKATGLPGVLLMQQMVNTGRYNREIDAIYIHPRGVLTMEAKHSRGSGQIEPYSGLWRVGGKDDPSLGDPWYQAGQQSRVLASALAELGGARIRGVVIISGDKVKMDVVELNSDLRAGHISKLKKLVEASLGDVVSYGVADVLAIRDVLNINPSLITQSAVAKEWRGVTVVASGEPSRGSGGVERFMQMLSVEIAKPESVIGRQIRELYRRSVKASELPSEKVGSVKAAVAKKPVVKKTASKKSVVKAAGRGEQKKSSTAVKKSSSGRKAGRGSGKRDSSKS